MAILIDTSFLVAYSNTRDKNHDRSKNIAKDIFSGKYGSVVITDHIFDETITTCSSRIKKMSQVERLGDYILNSEFELVQIDSKLFNDSWTLFKEYHYSFTDCTSATFSKKYGIKYIASFDHHFDSFKWVNRIC